MSKQKKEALKCKVSFFGESCDGKTCILERFVNNKYKNALDATTGAVLYSKTIHLKDENKSIEFEIWDTPGIQKYRALAKIFYKDAEVCVLVYDITRKKSFEELKQYWAKVIKEDLKSNVSKL